MKSFDAQLEQLIMNALQEDIGDGDHSTLSCIPPEQKGKAELKIKQQGILAGMAIAKAIFEYLEPGVVFTAFKKDGERVAPNEIAFEVNARAHTILTGERLVLNCMQRMSGIATLTHAYLEKLSYKHTRLLDTRKTTPNFRLLEKEAVRIGGGVNHRFGLYDMMMLKDNHIDFCGSIEDAINKAAAYAQNFKTDLKIEIEARTMEDVNTICNFGNGKINRIMLDNFSAAEVGIALKIIDGKFETEASGNINLDNIADYAETGVDYISVGAIIHQAKSLDLSLKVII